MTNDNDDSKFKNDILELWSNSHWLLVRNAHQAAIYLFKVNNQNIRKLLEICSKLTIKTPEQSNWRHSGVFIVRFMKFCLLFYSFYCCFEQENAAWVKLNIIFPTQTAIYVL